MMDMSAMNEALSGMAPAEVALGAGLVAVIGTLLVVGQVVWFLVSAIGYYKMFGKAGQRSWFAFIPLLREFAMFKMSWNVKAFAFNTVFLAVFEIFNENDNLMISLVAAAFGIAWIVMQAKLMVRMAKAFGKGKGWAVLLFFLPFIATLILGFGSAEYLGNPEEQKEEKTPIEA